MSPPLPERDPLVAFLLPDLRAVWGRWKGWVTWNVPVTGRYVQACGDWGRIRLEVPSALLGLREGDAYTEEDLAFFAREGWRIAPGRWPMYVRHVWVWRAEEGARALAEVLRWRHGIEHPAQLTRSRDDDDEPMDPIALPVGP